MKKIVIISMAILVMSSLMAFISPEATSVDIYYFHFSRRCATCLNVENVSKESVEFLFPEQVKSGEMKFQSVNLDEKEGEALGKKLNIEGQTLIVICGGKRVDLTDKAFLYANGSPEKLKAEIRKAIDEVRK